MIMNKPQRRISSCLHGFWQNLKPRHRNSTVTAHPEGLKDSARACTMQDDAADVVQECLHDALTMDPTTRNAPGRMLQ